jgi:hypothetical protein
MMTVEEWAKPIIDRGGVPVSAQTRRQAWRKWINNSILDEFSRVDAIKGQSDRKRLTAVGKTRHTQPRAR